MAENETPSLAELYERYGYAVHRRCAYLLRDDHAAWDATQDVFIKAEKGRHKFEGRASWKTWLMRIATHHCLNVRRSWRVRRGAGVVDYEHSGLQTEATSEVAATVRGLLHKFDARTQAMVVHYYVDEMSQEEVALAVGLSVPTVRKRLRAFIRTSRRALTGDAVALAGRS